LITRKAKSTLLYNLNLKRAADLKQVGDDYGFDAAHGRVKSAQNADSRHGGGLRKASDRVQSQRGRVQYQCSSQHRLDAKRHGSDDSGRLAETLFQILKS